MVVNGAKVIEHTKEEKERLEKVEEMLEKYKNSELSMGLIESSIATIVFVPLNCFYPHEKKTPDDIRNTFGLFQLITLKLTKLLINLLKSLCQPNQ